MTIVQRDQQMKDKAGFDYKKSVIPFLPDEVKEFEAEAVKYLNGGYANPDDFTKFRLVRGVYGQRQPNVQMMRIKLPGGYASPEQLEALGKVIEKFAPLKKGHITTRENVQIHHIPLEDTPEIMRMLGASGLSTREACGNTVRNVIGSPLTGVSPDEPFFVAPYLAAFVRWFVRHPHAQALPRKFKVAFASTPEDDVVTDIHDLGFLPRMQKGPDGRERKGFKIVAGGGTSIMARLAHTLYEFVPVEEYLRVSEAVVRIFNRTEELRKNRARARIKFYIDRVGIEAFRAEVEEELKQPWAKQNFDPTPLMEVPVEFQETPPAPVPAPRSDGHMEPEFLRWHKDNVQPQKQKGYNIVWVTLPLGDVRHDQFPVLARIAREYTGGNAHMTPDQNLLYRWVPDGRVHQVWKLLKEAGLAEPGVNRITDVVSCPGTDSCKLGITSSMGLGDAMREEMHKLGSEDPLVQEMHIRISGCPNGCSRHHIANIGFHGAAIRVGGQQVPAYEMFVGGNFGNGDAARFGQRAKTKIPAKNAPAFVTAAVKMYQAQRKDGESFNAFVDRVGVEPFDQVAQGFKDVGPLNRDTIGMYMDWSKTVLYKLERGEGECAV